MRLIRLTLAIALSLLASQFTFAQDMSSQLAGVVGAPFSAVRSQQSARNFADGNRIDRGANARWYRDSQGRTRIERDVPAEMLTGNPQMEPLQILITDPVRGERYLLQPHTKMAVVFKMGRIEERRPAPEAPAIFVMWGGHIYGPDEPGWSKQESLGEQSIEGVRAIGARRQYTLSTGTVGNEKPIVLTVEQWYSPDLGLLLKKSSRATTGAALNVVIESVVRADPDPALFTIPADYKRMDTGRPSAPAQ
jgi:hypothetical protein